MLDRHRSMVLRAAMQSLGVSAWLRNGTLSGNVSSEPDVLNPANPAIQAVDARRPAGNADGSLTFATNDVLAWPLVAANNGTRQWGCAFWVDHDALGAGEAYACITNLTGGASAMKIDWTKLTTNFMRVDLYVDASNARRITGTSNALGTTPAFVTLEIDVDAAGGETNQIVMTVDGTVITFTGSNLIGTPNLALGLASVTGNMLIGNRRDSTAASPLNGRRGRNMFFANAKMAGVTQGIWTPAARTALRGLDVLV